MSKRDELRFKKYNLCKIKRYIRYVENEMRLRNTFLFELLDKKPKLRIYIFNNI